MEPRVNFITLGVDDLDAARRFYVDGLGWAPAFEVPGEVVFVQVGPGLLLSLWTRADLDVDSGVESTAALTVGVIGGFALAHNVDREEAVVQVMDDAAAAGATILKPAQRADFGGFHGYFADPSGVRWEVAHNPGWSVAPDGRVTIGPIGPIDAIDPNDPNDPNDR
jgi:catechol 2,3-dioxygenase-like lactoylglutathione lyase family enzyme